MTTEIELKYLVYDDDVESRIHKILATQNVASTVQHKSLYNCYFDTDDLVLRGLDMGLRVRRTHNGKKSSFEQTIKTRGNTIGGLHQRPEYNIAINDNFPVLALFESAIWPNNLDVQELQNTIRAIFSTDFSRTTWLLSYDNGDQIELAFDQGKIATDSECEEISEIELELMQGDSQRLLELAYSLTAELKIRPGIKSKAARGYVLAKLLPEKVMPTNYLLVPLKSSDTIVGSCISGLNFVINQIQLTIENYVNDPSLVSLVRLTDFLALIRHGLWLYNDYFPEELTTRIQTNLKWALYELKWVEQAKQISELTSKTGFYRRKIEYSQALSNKLKLELRNLPDLNELRNLFYSEQFNCLQLDLLQLLMMEAQFNANLEEEQSLRQFAVQWLEASLTSLESALPSSQPLSCETFLAQHRVLARSLLTGFWFGQLFDEEDREQFRNPWFDLKQGIDELESLTFLQQQLNQVASQPLNEQGEQEEKEGVEKLNAWLTAKIDTLMSAMHLTHNAAGKLPPYWRS